MSDYPMMVVDVFGVSGFSGNPVAVIFADEGLSSSQMQRIANWTNLSETTFVSAPQMEGADYKVRIFTPSDELPFAGHPTLGSAFAWQVRDSGPVAAERMVVQECGVGLVRVAVDASGARFEAPPTQRSGPVEAKVRHQALSQIGVVDTPEVRVEWADNGAGWIAVILDSPEDVLSLSPSAGSLDVGVCAWYGPPGTGRGPGGADLEVRAFFPVGDDLREDPVTGSLNAALAQLFAADGLLNAGGTYRARQGSAMGRDGVVDQIREAHHPAIWVRG